MTFNVCKLLSLLLRPFESNILDLSLSWCVETRSTFKKANECYPYIVFGVGILDFELVEDMAAGNKGSPPAIQDRQTN